MDKGIYVANPYGHHIHWTTEWEIYQGFRKEQKLDPHKGRSNGITTWVDMDRLGNGKLYLGFLVYWDGRDEILLHELCHVCFGIFENIGDDPKLGGSEPFCYLLEHMFREILNAASGDEEHEEKDLRPAGSWRANPGDSDC